MSVSMDDIRRLQDAYRAAKAKRRHCEDLLEAAQREEQAALDRLDKLEQAYESQERAA